jgi:hypothetical protein
LDLRILQEDGYQIADSLVKDVAVSGARLCKSFMRVSKIAVRSAFPFVVS